MTKRLNQHPATVWVIACFDKHREDRYEQVRVTASSKAEAISRFREDYPANWRIMSVRNTGESPSSRDKPRPNKMRGWWS